MIDPTKLSDVTQIAALKKKAKAGDKIALQMLRDSGYFERQKVIKEAKQDGYELSAGQRRLWMLHQLDGVLTAYNISYAFELEGKLDTAAFCRAFEMLVERHDSLRTSFRLTDAGTPRQFVADGVTEQGRLRVMRGNRESLIRKHASFEFDLTQHALYRADLLELEAEKHLFLFTIQHIVADEWSMTLLMAELATLYRALIAGLPNPLPVLPLQYHDYARWQNQVLAGEDGEKGLFYWRTKLGGELPQLDMPADRSSRPPVMTFDGAIVSCQLSADLTAQLKKMAQRQGCTLFMALNGWVKMLLFRYTGQADLIIGTPIAGRDRAEWQRQVGFMVNMLALRDKVAADDSFVDLLARVRDTTLEAFAHQLYPFDQLVDELKAGGDLARHPIFDVVVNLQYAENWGEPLEGIKLAAVETDTVAAKFDLMFDFVESADHLQLHLTYNTHLYRPERIERLWEHMERLLIGALAEPTAGIGRLPILAPSEREQILFNWNQAGCDNVDQCSLVQVFEAQAMATPAAIALVFEGETVQYGELNERANQLGHYLVECGVRPGDLVGIAIERSIEMVVGLLGILKAGGAYVPLDPDYPAERLKFMLADTQVAVLLTRSDLKETFYSFEGVRIAVDTLELEQMPSHNLPVKRDGESLAYVMYTSGSTGRPKGVMVPHRAILRLVMGSNFVHISESETFLLFASISFDASTFELWGALLNGAKLVIAPPHQLSLAELGVVIRENEISILWLTAGLFAQMVDERLDDLKGVRQLLAGGDILPLPQVEKVLSYLPDCRLINGYGPTENTTFTCCHFISWDDIEAGGSIPIGRPVNNTQIYILDGARRPVPVGVWGELYAAGDGLAIGYLNQPELTAERFVVWELAGDNWKVGPTRLYRTGDMVRYLPNGDVQFAGRRDNQVKLRGYRIELDEIEFVLNQHELVAAAAVRAEDDQGDKRLVAYVLTICDDEAALRAAGLHAFLQSKLPSYMLPSRIALLRELPLSANGKIDRKRLPDFEREVAVRDAFETLLPATPTERALAQIWRALLSLPQVQINQNFFDIGGHSLLATRVVALVQKELGVELRLRDLFLCPTIKELAALVDQSHGGVFQPIAPVAFADSYPVSHAQRRLWLIEKIGVKRAAYNIPAAIWLPAGVSAANLQVAIDTLVARHEVLRTRFLEQDDEPVQVVEESVDCRLSVMDAADWSADQLARQVHLAAAKPFSLEHTPLFKFTLFQTENRPLLLLSIHHIISDGWSLQVMFNELLLLLNGAVIPPLTIQYKAYAAWQNQRLSEGDEVNSHRRFWLEKLSGDLPVLTLPTDYPRPPVQSFAGAEFSFTFPPDISSQLLYLGETRGATPFMTLLALVNGLLYRYTGDEDLIVGVPVAGREHPDLLEQVGFYVNMVAVRQQIDPDMTLGDLILSARDQVTEAFDHQIYPFDKLVEELEVRHDLGRSPVFDVAVSLQNFGDAYRSQDDFVGIEPFDMQPEISKWDMTFFFQILSNGCIHLNLEYSTDLFKRERIERLVAHLCRLGEMGSQVPTTPLSQLALLLESERALMAKINQEAIKPYPKQKTLVSLFEEWVAHRPDAAAVCCDDVTLTYEGLNKWADRLARILYERYGIGLEEPVGVFVDRSEWTAVALLGILKAGGAYLPIDPAAPASRVTYMLQDSGCRVVLVDEDAKKERLGTADCQLLMIRDALLAQNGCHDLDKPMCITAAPSSLAYIIYTSGSTGQPKGTLIEQRSVLRLVLNTNYIDLNEKSRILQTGSLAFDASTFEIWGALLNGGTLCLPRGGTLLDSHALGRLINQHQVNTLFLTTSLFNQLVEADITVFAGVKTVLSGGEKVSAGHFEQLRQAFPAIHLLHVYGPTENTTFSTYYPVETVYEYDVPIGFPIANSSVAIVDRYGRPVPVGVTGEICVGGDGIFRGYLNQPELTAERLLKIDGERFYRTGDAGVWLSNGAVKFIGRIDNQLKIRGFRVEPGEIEQCAFQHPQIQEAVVTSRVTTVGTHELLLYFVADPLLGEDDLRTYLSQSLPSYMIPAYFVRLDQFKLNQSGKIDRATLPEPTAVAGESRPVRLPRDEREQALLDVWQDVLRLPQIDIDANYFELGGDSIRAIQITSRLLRLGWRLEIQDLFALGTIAELGGMLQSVGEKEIDRRPVVGEVPLTAIQRWFFTEHQRGGDLCHFNQAMMLEVKDGSRVPELEGGLNINALKAALVGLVKHHDMLRVRLNDVDGGIRQTIVLEDGLDFTIVTVENAQAFESAVNEAHRQFDFAQGTLFKVVLFRLESVDRLLLVAHHLLVDGVSWRILLEDLEIGYRQAIAGEPVELGGKTTAFQAWAQKILAYAAADGLQAVEDYWRDVCLVAEAVPERLVESDQNNLFGTSETVSITLSESETDGLLRDTHHAYHTEMNDILLTALALAFKSWDGRDRTVITLEGHGRDGLTHFVDETDAEINVTRTVGWFTTLYPFVLELAGDAVGEQIKRIKEQLRQLPNNGFDYGVLRYVAGCDLPPVRPLLSFNYLGQFDEVADGMFQFSDAPSGLALSPNLNRQHALDLVGVIASGRLMVSLTFNQNSDQLSKAEAQSLLDQFKAALLTIVDHCRERVKGEKTASDFTAAVSEDDLDSIMGLFNG